jgi:hypothetical protein
VGQRQVGRVQSERLVDGGDGRATQSRDSLQGALLGQVAADDLVDLVNLDRRD